MELRGSVRSARRRLGNRVLPLSEDGTRVVLAEDADNGEYTVEARVTLAPKRARRIVDSSRYGPPPQARFETPGVFLEGDEPCAGGSPCSSRR